MNPRTLVLSWLRTHTRKPGDSYVQVLVSELQELERQLLDGKPSKLKGKGSRGPRQQKGMTSNSKQRKRPDTEYLAFVRRHPCCNCGDTDRVEAHHAGRKRDKGFGRKPPDSRCVPLCHACHHCFHADGAFDGDTPQQTLVTVEAAIELLQAEWAELQKKDEAF
jgi:hypothetical protein